MSQQGRLDFGPRNHVPPRGWQPAELPDLSAAHDVGVDFETTGLRWWAGDRPVGLAVQPRGGPATYVAFGHAAGNIPEDAALRWAMRELRDKHLFGLNIKFDLHVARAWGLDLEAQGCEAGDVGHRAALLDDHRQHFSLEAISQDMLGEGKVKGLDPKRMAEYTAWEVEAYARQDVSLVMRLLDVMEPKLVAEDLGRVVSLEDAAVWPTVEMEECGCPLDVELLDEWKAKAERELLQTLYEICRETGIAMSVDSPDDMERLFAARGIKTSKLTATGKPSFDAAVVKAAAARDAVVAKARHARKLSSLLSKYLAKYQKSKSEGGLLRYALHQLRADEGGTVSGRYSSSALLRGEDGEEGANVQQVMAVAKQKEEFGDDYVVRRLFVPEKGKLFLAADAKQVEFRIFAHLANSRRLLDAYAKDPDTNFHNYVWEMVRPLRPDIAYKSVKNLNFAKLYGAGLAKVAEMLGLSQEEARPFVTAYDRAFPEVGTLLRKAMRLAEERGYVKTMLGRRMRFPTRERTHKALNGAVQGGAADVMKQKVVELHAERKRTGFKMRMTVHDEVCGDVPDRESARLVGEVLDRQSFPTRVPILWDVRVGNDWAECA